MPFRARRNYKKKRYQRQNVKRNTKSMMKYGENRRQRPQLILNTIQPSNYVPQSVTIRHTYDNTFWISNMAFTKGSQENHHINFLPNSLIIFNENGANTSLFKYGKTVIDAFADDGSTTDLDHTLAGAGWANKYKKAQVMVCHYNFNIRQISTATQDPADPNDRIQPLTVSFIRAHQAAAISNLTPIEDIQKKSFTQTRYLSKSRTENGGVVNLKCAHYPSRFNGAQKNYVNNPEYCINTGNTVLSNRKMMPGEKDFATLAFSLPSSALHSQTTTKNPISGQILCRMRISSTVRYSEA